ncbi:curli-like amyloid fiber formation chaperone CsgH [Rhizobium calliandrae]|uniref:Curli-like amyloid fiber formation chaperone CsgH n=1 Tax=Rhizobium calliandrae TaxID=1312182 RepID=A0ABT7KLQ4_9HYPH|nr:curli-like amyloid fiber formation chaperone CsgH [Rhizobium calliandrae]MDL2409573.1 curli-like amyloid fiber formation chaperone CsgH [Rhizobium calliandrae]
MHGIVNHPRRIMTALALVLVPAAALATMAGAGQPSAPLRCEIRAAPEGGMLALEAVAHANKGVSGTYSFHVESAGRNGGTNIEQSGDFHAASGQSATLGTVTLDAKGGVYDAVLDMNVGGQRIGCTQRVGGAT